MSTWSDGSVGDAGAAAAAAAAAVSAEGGMDSNFGSISGSVSEAMPTDTTVYEGYPDGIFDSFVDVPSM